ncbi:PTS sugar transporter subunit IIB [Spiroplasma endosymbiont of Aspidapion aeneum]|uniref:PTS sugar transporter subunit IIB n=1 Tax=Spiroplasma endosymbiont of Aspidapion aeneum TaxID=3066276 RepID=UPI00313C9250
MRKILLACAGGMSTSIIVGKMNKYASSQGIEVEIKALAANEALERLKEGWEIILLGPQVKFYKEQLDAEIKKENLTIPVYVIPFQDYGSADGEAILKMAFKLLGDK